VRNFQILIVSVIKICKQCLQRPHTPTGASPLDSLEAEVPRPGVL